MAQGPNWGFYRTWASISFTLANERRAFCNPCSISQPHGVFFAHSFFLSAKRPLFCLTPIPYTALPRLAHWLGTRRQRRRNGKEKKRFGGFKWIYSDTLFSPHLSFSPFVAHHNRLSSRLYSLLIVQWLSLLWSVSMKVFAIPVFVRQNVIWCAQTRHEIGRSR